MSLLDQLQKDLVAAMKAREEARLSAIRMIKTALQKAHVDAAKPWTTLATSRYSRASSNSESTPPRCFARADAKIRR